MTKEEKKLFSLAEVKDDKSEVITAPNYSYWRSVIRTFFAKKMNYVMLGLLLVVILLSFFQPMFSGIEADIATNTNPNILDQSTWFNKPSWEHLFGTSSVGRDLFDEVWAGTKTSLMIAIICTIINVVIGIAVGAAWGYSKALDRIMIEIYNIISNVPFILFITVFMYITGAGFWQLILAMTITGWVGIAYFIRNQVIIIRDREYNLASRCLGTPIGRMLVKNILPYMTSVIVTLIANEVPSYISYEVFLSYIGVGIDASRASLGRMINDNISFLATPGKSYTFWLPVAVSAIVTITLYVVGQNLADASDPRRHM